MPTSRTIDRPGLHGKADDAASEPIHHPMHLEDQRFATQRCSWLCVHRIARIRARMHRLTYQLRKSKGGGPSCQKKWRRSSATRRLLMNLPDGQANSLSRK